MEPSRGREPAVTAWFLRQFSALTLRIFNVAVSAL
jgi:hypothetical protein